MTSSKVVDLSKRSFMLCDVPKSCPRPPVKKQLLGTYSYCSQSGSGAKLLIPGRPPIFSPPDFERDTHHLQQDSDRFIDENGSRLPRAPMEPAAHAILSLKPTSFQFSDLNAIIDRNLIRKLYKVVAFEKVVLAPSDERCRGSIANWKRDRGFGFIKVNHSPVPGVPVGSTVFCHSKSLHLNPDIRQDTIEIRDGTEVEFDIQFDDRGKVNAINVGRPGGLLFTEPMNEYRSRFGVVKCGSGPSVFRRMEYETMTSRSGGYGKSFEDEVCRLRDNPRGLSGYWQIIQFKIGDLNIAVRGETDCLTLRDDNAFYPYTFFKRPEESCKDDASCRVAGFSKNDGLIDISLYPTIENHIDMSELYDAYECAELKCLSDRNGKGWKIDDPESVYLQLLLGDAGKIIIAEHCRGRIRSKPCELTMSEFSARFELDIDTIHARLTRVMDILVMISKKLEASPNVPHVVYFDTSSGGFELVSCEEASPLSDAMMALIGHEGI